MEQALADVSTRARQTRRFRNGQTKAFFSVDRTKLAKGRRSGNWIGDKLALTQVYLYVVYSLKTLSLPAKNVHMGRGCIVL